MTDKKNRKQTVTLKDVAAAAGVSIMSVSNVVNGRTDLVGERTRRIIEREIKRLRYQPQAAARSLRTGKTNTVGLAIIGKDPDLPSPKLNWEATAMAFVETVSSQNHQVSVTRSRKPTFISAIQNLPLRLDGLAVILGADIGINDEDLEALKALKYPVVELLSAKLLAAQDVCCIYETDGEHIDSMVKMISKTKTGPILVINHALAESAARRRVEQIKSNQFLRDRTVKTISLTRQDGFMLLNHLRRFRAKYGFPAAIITTTELDALLVLQEVGTWNEANLKSQLYCAELSYLPLSQGGTGNIQPPRLITGIVPVGHRVGHVAGNALASRLSVGNFAFRHLTVECDFVQSLFVQQHVGTKVSSLHSLLAR